MVARRVGLIDQLVSIDRLVEESGADHVDRCDYGREWRAQLVNRVVEHVAVKLPFDHGFAGAVLRSGCRVLFGAQHGFGMERQPIE